jgi:hypothetical protein
MTRTHLTRRMPMRRTGFKAKPPVAGAAPRAPMKSKGMKGRAPTAAEERHMSAIAGLGCIACRKDGIVNPWISLHHIDGRTKPGAHLEVLPLCAPHHQQDDTDPLQRPSVHGRKATFTARYGTEQELLAECLAMIKGAA